MLCAKLGEWPFDGGPGKATAAQVAMFTSVWLDLLPKAPETPKPVDDMTWREWQSMWSSDDGPA